MQYFQFINTLKKEKLFPVYLFAGEEIYFQEEGLKLLLKQNNLENSNYNIFYADEIEMNELLDQFKSFPLLERKRVIIIKRIDELKEKELLVEYLKNPVESTLLCLFGDKINKKSLLYQLIEKKGRVINCSPLYRNQIPFLIKEYVRKINKEISKEAIELLLEKIGNNIKLLFQEIEKISIYIYKRKKITLFDIEELTFSVKSEDVYKLCNAILNKEKIKALNYYWDLVVLHKDPTLILATLTYQFRKIWRVKLLCQNGVSYKEICNQLHINFYFIKDFINTAKLFSLKNLKEIFEAFLNTDEKIKRGKENPYLAIELLIIQICQ